MKRTCTIHIKIKRFEIINHRFITQRDETIASRYVPTKQLPLIAESGQLLNDPTACLKLTVDFFPFLSLSLFFELSVFRSEASNKMARKKRAGIILHPF